MLEFRKLIAEWLIDQAFFMLPSGSTEKVELARFIFSSWIGESVRQKKF